MNTYNYDKALLEAIKAKVSKEINPVWFIMDKLSISKEAAYRRMRGEVPLTFKEAAMLSLQLGISLNEVMDMELSRVHYYKIFMVNFEAPGPDDYKVLEAGLDNIRRGYDDPHSQLTITANVFPQQLYMRYKSIAQLAVFKWIHQNSERKVKAYHQIKIEERMLQVFRDLREAYRQIRTTYYIFDRLICRSLVQDLRYFSSIGLLRDEDRDTILSDAHRLLDYMEQLAITGKHENGNEVHMYVSDILFNKSFFSLKAGQYHLSAIETCVLNHLSSTEETCFNKMNQWIHSRRRISTLISCSGESHRIEFFKELHRQLDE